MPAGRQISGPIGDPFVENPGVEVDQRRQVIWTCKPKD
jgi:hypothetical protein